MGFQLIYEVSSGMMEAAELLQIESSGAASYHRYSNAVVDQTLFEIGAYQTQLPQSDLAAVLHAADTPALGSVPDHAGRLNSGAFYRRVEVTNEGGTIRKIAGDREPVDPTLTHLFGQLDALAAQVRRHPSTVVRMRTENIRQLSPSVIGIDMSFMNTGTETASLRDPRTMAGSPEAGISILYWPEGGDRIVVDSDVRVEAVSGPMDLPPAKTLSFLVAAPIPQQCSSGCMLRVSYLNSMEQADNRKVLRGFLLSTVLPVPRKA